MQCCSLAPYLVKHAFLFKVGRKENVKKETQGKKKKKKEGERLK